MMCSFLIRELGEKEFHFFHLPDCKGSSAGDFVINYFLGNHKDIRASNFKVFSGNTKFQLRYLDSVAIFTETLEVVLDNSEKGKTKLSCKRLETEVVVNPLLLDEGI
jgi:hypothetical protein